MRISGAPSMIRKSSSSNSIGSAELHQKQKKFIPPIRVTGAIQPTLSRRTLGPQSNAGEVDSLNFTPSSVTTSTNLIPVVRQLDKDIITLTDDDDPKAPEDNDCERGSSALLSLPNKRQGVVRTGEPYGRKKARLGVGSIKLGFKPPAPAGTKSLSPKHLDSSSCVHPNEPTGFSSGSNKPKIVGRSKGSAGDEPSSSYFCVMYCTRKVNAKHKGPWSDGVLISRGRSCVLQDTDGKIVTKDNCHRCGDMSEGATFPLGKFEVEIMKTSTEQDFLSGKIFSGAVDELVNTLTNPVNRRSFRKPVILRSSKGGAAAGSSTHLSSTVKDDSLLLNAREVQRGAKPVIVDPYLACKLRKHQQEGVKFMYECVMGVRSHKFTGCLLADAMGLGKTLQVIALIWTLLHQGPNGHSAVNRVLVICPSSLVENWGKEICKWLGNERLKALIVHSGASASDVNRKLSTFQLGKVSPVLVTSYELLRKYNDDLVSAKPDLLVCDEAHRLKNCAGNKTIGALLGLQCSMKILLTGTPVQNDLMEFYAMLDFSNRGLLGTLSAFKRLYADPIEKSRDRNATEEEKNLGRKRSEELMTRTRPYILQRSSDVNLMYLPEKMELVVFCKLQAPQISLYQKFLSSKTVETLFNTSSQSAVILSAIGTLRKICNHPKLVHDEVTSEKSQRSPGRSEDLSGPSEIISESDWTSSGKLNCLYKIMSAVHLHKSSGTADKIVVVSNFTQTLDIIEKLCVAKGWKWLRLDGSTDVSERQTKVDRFNVGYGVERVFLLSSKAGGSGLNLVGANRLVLFDPDWNPATDAQAMARVWRDGQKKPVLIYRLLSTGSIEEKIYQRQIMKQEVAAAVGELGAGRSGHGERHFSREELRELFTLRLETRCDTHDLLARSVSRQSGRWRDFSQELQDYALEEAIQTGVVTFVYRNVAERDTNSPDVSTGDDSSFMASRGDNHGSYNQGDELCAQELPYGVIESCRLSESDCHFPPSMNLSSTELSEDRQQNYRTEDCYLPGSERSAPTLPPEDVDNLKDQGISLTNSSRPGTSTSSDVEVDTFERCMEHPYTLGTSSSPAANLSRPNSASPERVSDGEIYSADDSGLSKSQHEDCHLDHCPPSFQNNSQLETTSEPDKGQLSTSLRPVETPDIICQSENQCSCLLGCKGHKLLTYMLETLRPVASDLDDLEALDMPFLSSMELELKLQRTEFSPKKLWEGFKLFVTGFLLGIKQDQIFYGCSTLGLILDECNGDNASTAESTFCKSLPLVLSALSRSHGSDRVKLHTLLSLHEDREQLILTPVGRFLIELTRRCDLTDGAVSCQARITRGSQVRLSGN